jgi:hypothetical protein
MMFQGMTEAFVVMVVIAGLLIFGMTCFPSP